MQATIFPAEYLANISAVRKDTHLVIAMSIYHQTELVMTETKTSLVAQGRFLYAGLTSA